MKSSPANTLLLLLLLVFCPASPASPPPGKLQEPRPPIPKAGLLKALRLNGLSNEELVRQIRQRGVGFRLTPDVEGELRAAGATQEVIAAVRESYRPPRAAEGGPDERGRREEAVGEDSPGLRFYEEGNRLSAQRRLAEAVAAYEQAIRLDPRRAAFNNGLGMAQLGLKQYAEALGSFKQAALLDPGDAEAQMGLGAAYRGMQRYGESVEALEKAIRLAPHDPTAYTLLGNTYVLMGSYADALGALKQAVRLKPDFETYDLLSLTYDRMDRHQESLDAARESVRLKPDSVAGHNRMAYAYNQLGQPQEALREAQQALELSPTPGGAAFAYYNMGNAYFALNARPKAADSFRKAVELFKRLPEPLPDQLFYAGNAQQQLGQLQEAITSYRKAVEMRPTFAQAHLSLGLAYAAAGNKRSAMEEYRALKALDAARADRLLKFINAH